jgi:hypothetical protein
MRNIKCPHCSKEIPLDAILQEELNEAIVKERQKVEKGSLMQIREQEKIINDLKGQLNDALRKANQSSMERQGTIAELEILRVLREDHAGDLFEHTPKGVNGADILHTVKNLGGSIAGRILVESKNTRSYSSGWIPKIKEDNLKAKADIMIIITQALPKSIERCGIEDGVWVCGFDYYRELILSLRYSLLKIHALSITNQGQNGKMEKLYHFLTSENFKFLFENILQNFEAIRESHQSEQATLRRLWAKRERLMEHVLTSSLEFYSTVKDIAGADVPEIKKLELPGQD